MEDLNVQGSIETENLLVGKVGMLYSYSNEAVLTLLPSSKQVFFSIFSDYKTLQIG